MRIVRTAAIRWSAMVAIAAGTTAACGDVNAALQRLADARQLSADLVVQFTKAADAANRSVMADTDLASVAFAQEAEQAKQTVHRDLDTLGPMLRTLGYAEEIRLLGEFNTRFAEYEVLDRRILDLAVENTNLKAQRLSFGAGQEAAAAFQAALEAVAPAAPDRDNWQVKARVASAIEAVREIQVLEAPHIAEPDDAPMTRIEKQMSASEAGARRELAALAPHVAVASRSHLADATAALDRFMKVNGEILALSRQNTNVRSLAMSLNQKPALVTACEASLHALQEALSKRGYGVARWK